MIKRRVNYGLIGLAGGVVGGLFGVGGGVIMVPLLTLAGISQKRAQGTSLAATIPLAAVSAAIYFQAGSFDLGAAIPLAIGGIIGAYIGAGLVRRFSNRLLYRLFGIMLLIIAARHIITVLALANGVEPVTVSPIFALPAGILAGLISGFFGVGGGVVFVPAGVQLLGLGEKAAQGISFVAIIPTAIIGYLRYRGSGETHGEAMLPLIAGAMAGSLISATIARGIADDKLAIGFAILLAIVALRRILWRNPQTS